MNFYIHRLQSSLIKEEKSFLFVKNGKQDEKIKNKVQLTVNLKECYLEALIECYQSY